jgi:hypothetical protein
LGSLLNTGNITITPDSAVLAYQDDLSMPGSAVLVDSDESALGVPLGPGQNALFAYRFDAKHIGENPVYLRVYWTSECDPEPVPSDDSTTVPHRPGVVIIEPYDLAAEHVVESQTFELIANIYGGPGDVVDVRALAVPSATVTSMNPLMDVVIESEAYDQKSDDGDDCYKAPVEWTVHCDEGGLAGVLTDLTVEAEWLENWANDDTVSVDQKPGHPKLVVEIIKPEFDQTHVSDIFSVWGKITNVGGEPALNVGAEITFDPVTGAELGAGIDATKWLVDKLEPGEFTYVDWTVHCRAPGLVDITVTPMGRDDVTYKWLKDMPGGLIVADTFTMKQVPPYDMSVDFIAPTPGDMTRIGFGEQFLIRAEVENLGYATLWFDPVRAPNGIFPALEVDPPGSISLQLVSVGNLADGELKKDESALIVWQATCTDAEGPSLQYLYSTFTVTAKAKADICDCYVEDFDTRTVKQKFTIVDIIDPVDGHWFRYDANFFVGFCVEHWG